MLVRRFSKGKSMECERCGADTISSICSMFSTEQICPSCATKEQKHPDYERARRAEAKAVRNGDYNFEGIGKPRDL